MKSSKSKLTFTLFFLFVCGFANNSSAQIWIEPKLDEVNKIGTPYDKGARQGMGVDIILNDFGFSLGTQYRYLFSSKRELTASISIGSLRDVSEQTFTSFFSEIIPNKFQRVISIPITFGLKERLLADKIQDNFRVYVHAAAGPSLAFAYPYFLDYNGDGVRQNDFSEPVQDALSGWGDGNLYVGVASELMLGIDFGSTKKNFSSISFGIVSHYIPEGIQIMEVQTAGKQKFFIAPQFSLIFGGFWK
ncbi:hypothetical protein EP331_15140 [bacterium]|nr:MAG: hypothetical protein EP331_15140 [bacterium]